MNIPRHSHSQTPATNGYAFSLSKLVHSAILAVMVASVANSLWAFMPLAMAMVLGFVLTYLFSQVTDAAISPGIGKLTRFAAVGAAIVLATLTVGMSASTLWSTMFAQTSVAQRFARDRALLERQLMQTVALADSAKASVLAWENDAKEKAKFEKDEGGSCVNLANVGRRRGRVYYFREDDIKVAGPLAVELGQWSTALKGAFNDLKAMPEAKEFPSVRAAMEKANRAIDTALPLSKNGAFSEGAIKTLMARKTAMVSVDSDGKGSDCGDEGRVQLIARAITSLTTLSTTQVQGRMAAAVDLNNPKDITVRGWLRSANITAAIFHLGGRFTDDPLWQEATELNGRFNRESLSFLMAIVLELSVVLSKILIRIEGAGGVPFASSVIALVEQWVSAKTASTWKMHLAQAVAKLWCNMFYVVRDGKPVDNGSTASMPEVADEVLDSGLSPVRLGTDPEFSATVKQMAQQLLPFYDAWGDEKLLFIPQLLPTTQRAIDFARYLAGHELLIHLSSTVDVEQLQGHPTAKSKLDRVVGPTWKDAPVLIYRLDDQFARFMDRIATAALAPREMIVPVAIQPTNVSRQSLRRKMLERGLKFRSS